MVERHFLTVIVLAAAFFGCGERGLAGSVTEFLPDKARYAPGEVVTLTATIQAGAHDEYAGPIDLYVYRADRVTHMEHREVQVKAGEKADVTFRWSPPPDDFIGYLAVAEAGSSAATTGVDVSSSPFRYPRYGYVSDFHP